MRAGGSGAAVSGGAGGAGSGAGDVDWIGSLAVSLGGFDPCGQIRSQPEAPAPRNAASVSVAMSLGFVDIGIGAPRRFMGASLILGSLADRSGWSRSSTRRSRARIAPGRVEDRIS